jgi:hypothetical protein
MPMNLLNRLDVQRDEVLKFREVLRDSPVHLERAEAALRAFDRAREELRREAPRFHEEKGILAGLNLSGPIIRQHQEITKKAIADELLDPEAGKEMVKVLARAAESLAQTVESKTEEIQRKAGRLDGISWAARDALGQIEDVLRHYDAGRRQEEDEDWSGREAAAGGNGSGAPVVELDAARKNGGKKPRRKAARKPRAKKDAPPAEN